VVQTVIAGGPDAEETVKGTMALLVAISRDDPTLAVVLLNQVVLRRYLDEAVVPATEAIPDATRDAIDQIEKIAEAQAHWQDQVSPAATPGAGRWFWMLVGGLISVGATAAATVVLVVSTPLLRQTQVRHAERDHSAPHCRRGRGYAAALVRAHPHRRQPRSCAALTLGPAPGQSPIETT